MAHKTLPINRQFGNPDRAEGCSESEGMLPFVSAESRRLTNPEAALDLRSECPVCGRPYQCGDQVVALTCFAFAKATLIPGDGDKIILGHHGCVLPRLLTLLAGFQPESRFVKAARESIAPELYHDET